MWQDNRKRKSGPEVAVTLLLGGDSQQHELKATWTNGINADTYSHHSRYLAVFDGVSGVQPPWRPADMSAALAIQFESEMAKRFDQNAQVYDEAVRQRLSLSKKKETGEWLKNLLANALLNVQTGGSTTLAACVLTKGAGSVN